jgi:hypothetical protein
MIIAGRYNNPGQKPRLLDLIFGGLLIGGAAGIDGDALVLATSMAGDVPHNPNFWTKRRFPRRPPESRRKPPPRGTRGRVPTAVVTVVLLGRVGLRHATLTLEITTITDDKIALRKLLERVPTRHCCAR